MEAIISKEPRVYTEREFALILAKAAELAGSSPSAEGRADGLLLDDVKAIAAEVGLDPALVERAAHLVPQVSRGSLLERMAGGPLSSDVDLYFPVEFTQDGAEHLLAVLRSTLGRHGEGEATASGMSWSAGVVHASAHREGDGTRVRVVVKNRIRLFFPLMFGSMGVVAVILLAVLAAGGGEPNLVVLAVGLSAVAATVWRSLKRTARDTLDKLDRIVGALSRLFDRESAS